MPSNFSEVCHIKIDKVLLCEGSWCAPPVQLVLQGPLIVPHDPDGGCCWSPEGRGSILRMSLPSIASITTGGNTAGSHCPSEQTVGLCARPDGGHLPSPQTLWTQCGHKGWPQVDTGRQTEGHRSWMIVQNIKTQEDKNFPEARLKI